MTGARIDYFHPDAHDLYNSDLFDDSHSGVGGWGDPANDYEISTGGFKDLIVAYPTPHHIRRNFTLFPFANPVSDIFTGDPTAPPYPSDLMVNTTFTKEEVDNLVNSFEGDFIGFQAYIEAMIVSSTLPPLTLGLPDTSA